MTDALRPTDTLGFTCDEVAELAGLYVLDALEPAERAALAAHLVTCREAHEEVGELGSVVPALASLAPPIDAPAALRARVLDAVAQEAALSATTSVATSKKLPGRFSTRLAEPARPLPVPAPAAWRAPAWASWGAAMAAVLVLAVVGVWALGIQQRAASAEQRAEVLADAIAAFAEPGSSVAILRDSANPDASGFAAVSADGTAYLVMVGLPEAPAGQTYQAWYIANDQPVSAGLFTVDADGYAVLAGQPVSGTQAVALTREPAGGSEQPTSEPFVVGELRPAAA
ncbi:MAG: anti-sigma factor domain-containing protein [Candidatus Limnocylindrales bacterium]